MKKIAGRLSRRILGNQPNAVLVLALGVLGVMSLPGTALSQQKYIGTNLNIYVGLNRIENEWLSVDGPQLIIGNKVLDYHHKNTYDEDIEYISNNRDVLNMYMRCPVVRDIIQTRGDIRVAIGDALNREYEIRKRILLINDLVQANMLTATQLADSLYSIKQSEMFKSVAYDCSIGLKLLPSVSFYSQKLPRILVKLDIEDVSEEEKTNAAFMLISNFIDDDALGDNRFLLILPSKVFVTATGARADEYVKQITAAKAGIFEEGPMSQIAVESLMKEAQHENPTW